MDIQGISLEKANKGKIIPEELTGAGCEGEYQEILPSCDIDQLVILYHSDRVTEQLERRGGMHLGSWFQRGPFIVEGKGQREPWTMVAECVMGADDIIAD